MGNIDPRVDVAFKKIFGVEENKDLLMSLINSVVSEEDQVKEVTILNPYNAKNFRNDKLSILDIKAKGYTGKRYNIEIQISDEADYDKRALFYWAKMYTEQLESGKDYGNLNKAIGIHILNFTSIPEMKEYHNRFYLTSEETGIRYFDDLELHTIELKKFIEKAGDDITGIMEQIKQKIDIWAAFLTKHDVLNKASQELNGPLADNDLKKALEVLEVMNFNAAEREEYESHLKWLHIEANTIKKAETKAREEGREEGREKGRKERDIEIIKHMLSKNKSIEDIIELTGLTESEIKYLRAHSD